MVVSRAQVKDHPQRHQKIPSNYIFSCLAEVPTFDIVDDYVEDYLPDKI